MNSSVIELNNAAVVHLQQGFITKAYALLINACKVYNATPHDHHLFDIPSSEATQYRFGWVDCQNTLMKRFQEEQFSTRADDASSLAFMYFKFLMINKQEGWSCDVAGTKMAQEIDAESRPSCPCEFAWAIWYNTAIVSVILASLQNKSGVRRRLLEQALLMFGRAEKRVCREPPSKHWSLLSLAISNNQACVLRDLCRDNQTLEHLVNMGLTLTKTLSILNVSDVEPFHWTIQLLIQDNYAAAA